MRLPQALQNLILMLRRWLGLEREETPALPPGSSEGSSQAPALTAGGRSSPAEATLAQAPEGEPAVENEPEIVVEIDSAEASASADGVEAKVATPPRATPTAKPAPAPVSAPEPAPAPVSAPEPAPAPVSTPQPDPRPEPTSPLAVTDRVPPSKAPGSRRRRRAAAYAPLEPALAVTPVRRFFSRLTVQESSLFADSPWPQVRVESFFLSLTQPRQDFLLGRGPAVAEPQALADAFADFVWD